MHHLEWEVMDYSITNGISFAPKEKKQSMTKQEREADRAAAETGKLLC